MPPFNSEMFTYQKRSITDIFTPYSVNTIGDTANRNFLAMNDNFQKIQKNELRLAHQQQLLATNFCSMAAKEKKIARKELYLELRSFKANSLQNFMYDLNQILTTIQLDENFEIVSQIYAILCLYLL